MAPRIITLKYPGTCRACGARLPKGTRAEWLGRGHVECIDCSGDSCSDCDGEGKLFGGRDRDRGSVYTRFSSGAEIYTNRNGRCEDAPCCGCCS